jgi:hypothetical protein
MTDTTPRQRPLPVRRRLPNLRLAVYANKGVGKTALALTASRPLVVDTSFGLEGEALPPGTEVLEWTPEAWRDLNDLYFQHIKGNDAVDTIVVDQVDTLNTFLIQQSVDTWAGKERTANAGQLTLGGAVPEQRDYLAAAIALERFLGLLARSGKDVILLAHTAGPDFTRKPPRTRNEMDMNHASFKKVMEWANLLGELVLTEQDGKEARALRYSPDSTDYAGANRWRSTLGKAMRDPSIPKIKAAIAKSYKETEK